MVIWLLVPVVKCSVAVFRDEPLSSIDGTVAADADKERVEVGKGFWRTLTHGVGACYDATPLLDQEQWKAALLIGFASITVVGWAVGRIERSARSRR
jgi:hypothetical protein